MTALPAQLAALATPLQYSGDAPFGTCHLQCVANLLAWQHVENPAAALCPAWGFSWPGGTVLHGSGRWLTAVRALHQIDLAERRYPDFAAAHAAELESIASGYPAAAAVDAWYLPSKYRSTEHITHCVLVVGAAREHVSVIDPMNLPHAARYGIRDWEEMRSAPHADGFRTFFLTSGPRHTPSHNDLIRFLRADIHDQQAHDRQQLEAFLAFCQRGSGGGLIDVSEVAAERLYLAKLTRQAALEEPGLTRAADTFVSLSRRWYLAHSLARESAGQPGAWARQVRLLHELAERDLNAREQVSTLIDAASSTRPPGHTGG